MPLAKSHTNPDPAKRKPRAAKLDGKYFLSEANRRKYEKAEAIIDAVYCDYINGTSKSHVLKKLQEGIYEPQQGKGMNLRMSYIYFNAAFERMREDTQLNREEALAMLLSRFESIYEDGTVLGDRQSALRALENMAKIYGIDKPQTAIQVNTGGSEGVTINFGFKKEEEDAS